MLAGVGSVYVVQLPFSREMEAEADLIGLELMARAGYDPRLAANLWRKLQAQEGSSAGVVFFKTHPSNEFRLDQIERATPRVLTVYRPRSGSPDEPVVPRRRRGRPGASLGASGGRARSHEASRRRSGRASGPAGGPGTGLPESRPRS